MKFKGYFLFLAIFAASSGVNSVTSFCDDKTANGVYLDLSKVGIKVLRSKFVSSELITCLNLAYNRMSNIDVNAFAGLPNLTALNLAGNSIEFSTFDLYNFPKLKTLVLDETLVGRDLYTTTTDYYDYQSRRQNYDVTTLGIITEGISFPLLEELSMSNYRSAKVVNWLENFDTPNLKHLHLDGNEIITDDQLTSGVVKNLTHLQLNDNQISSFSGMQLTKLRHLSMNSNKIRRLCAIYCKLDSMILRTMLHLEHLSLAKNEITDIDYGAFDNSEELLSLNLAGNSIENFPDRAFDNMTKLQYLTLDDNRFTEIPDLCALTNLLELSIDGNRIISINTGSFCGLSKLTRVSLQRNGLTTVASGTFGNLQALKALDMSGNVIERLPEDWMTSGVEIEEIKLDGNHFIDVSDMSLGQLKTLKFLSIEKNPLKTVRISSLINLPVNTTLDIGTGCGNASIQL